MADVYARVSGKVGVCEGPSGGGSTYILPGVVEANESSIALLAITSDIGVGSRGRFALTELDQESLFRPVTKWNKVIDTSSSLPRTVRAAFRQMTSGRPGARSEEHTSELQSLMRISYAVFCVKKKKKSGRNTSHK